MTPRVRGARASAPRVDARGFRVHRSRSGGEAGAAIEACPAPSLRRGAPSAGMRAITATCYIIAFPSSRRYYS
eukprot:48031-Pyramimonas_sp.AAC.2